MPIVKGVDALWMSKWQDNSLGRKLTLLKGIAALVITTVAVILRQGEAIKVLVDSYGFCAIMKLGCLRCLLSWMVAKALADIRRVTDIRIEVVKTPRVVGVREKGADILSIGKMNMANLLMKLQAAPEWVQSGSDDWWSQ